MARTYAGRVRGEQGQLFQGLVQKGEGAVTLPLGFDFLHALLALLQHGVPALPIQLSHTAGFFEKFVSITI